MRTKKNKPTSILEEVEISREGGVVSIDMKFGGRDGGLPFEIGYSGPENFVSNRAELDKDANFVGGLLGMVVRASNEAGIKVKKKGLEEEGSRI